MRSRIVLTAALLAISACATQPRPSGRPGPFSNTITREELRTSETRNAYEAVLHLRPRWLQVRSVRSFSMETGVVVFQDRIYLGGTDALERIGIDGVYSMEYLDGATAQATLPGIKDLHVEGAIVIHMSPPLGRD